MLCLSVSNSKSHFETNVDIWDINHPKLGFPHCLASEVFDVSPHPALCVTTCQERATHPRSCNDVLSLNVKGVASLLMATDSEMRTLCQCDGGWHSADPQSWVRKTLPGPWGRCDVSFQHDISEVDSQAVTTQAYRMAALF